jgi:DNA-directed RNA polymerase specialized sigma24 family protein
MRNPSPQPPFSTDFAPITSTLSPFGGTRSRSSETDQVPPRQGCLLQENAATLQLIERLATLLEGQYRRRTTMSEDEQRKTLSGSFPTTAWRFIEIAQDAGHVDYVPAINGFIAAYWKPVFVFLRARGLRLHHAEDLTQGFFLKFLEHDWLQKADPARGRFRNYLLRLLVWFIADQRPKRSSAQRRFEQNVVSVQTLITDDERSFEPSTDETPESAFMKQWAASLVEKVRNQLRDRYRAGGREHWYEVFAARHFPETPGDRPSQDALATKHGLDRNEVRKILAQVQNRFDRLLRAEVRDEGGDEAEIEQELAELLSLLERR